MRGVHKFALALAMTGFFGSAAFAFPVVSYVDQTSLYKPSVISAGGFNVELRGAPAPGMDAAAIVAGLHGPAWAGGAPLSPLPANAAPGKGTRLVLIFNGASAPSETACTDAAALGGAEAPQGAPFRVIAVYCMSDRMVARGALSADSVQGPGDENYRAAMQSLLAAMFPPQGLNISPFGGGI